MKNHKNLIILLACLVIFSSLGCNADPALKDVYAGKFLIGGALNVRQITGENPEDMAIVTKHFNTITPENVLKWQKVHPEPGLYDFEPADKFVEIGEKNGMFVVGHILVWHHQTPQWVFHDADGNDTDRRTLLKRMREHIYTVVGRYKGRVNAWDVVNEALDPNGNMRDTRWKQIIGNDYIEKAFTYAHEADPDAELYYNDFDMWKPAKFAGVVRLVKNLQAKGIRIDGIGMQGHWGFDYPTSEELEAAIAAYSQTGLKVDVTELDISALPNIFEDIGAEIDIKSLKANKHNNPYPDGLPPEMQKKLAERYAEIFTIFCKHADKIGRVTFWGVDDGDSWRNNWPITGRTDYPLLFDRKGKPKKAFDAVVKVGTEVCN